MKQIIILLVAVGIIFFIGIGSFGTKSSVETPDIKKSSNYERPVKDGNCYIQTDSTGNKLRVCG